MLNQQAEASMLPKQGVISNFHLLGDGIDAFAARLYYIDQAHYEIDLQYYIYRNDSAGKILNKALLDAADRGVRIRLLVDDFGQIDDDALLAFSHHSHIQVKLFNPVKYRKFRYVEMLAKFSRQSRRMHNKVFIVDDHVSILGGRNIGDMYYFRHGELAFSDLDVLAIGDIVKDLKKSFLRFWQHELARDIESILGSTDLRKHNRYLDQLERFTGSKTYVNIQKAIGTNQFLASIKNQQVDFEETTAQIVCDHPDKILNVRQDKQYGLAEYLWKIFDNVEHSVLLVSPYFVPGRRLIRRLRYWKRKGYPVTILTNSLSASDVPIVHSAYSRYRRRLLRSKVDLWELKSAFPEFLKEKNQRKKISRTRESLHAKTLVLDTRTVFIGSMNLDHRSININTEVGIFIESEKLAYRISQAIYQQLPEKAWQLDLTKLQQVAWYDQTQSDKKCIALGTEPHTSLWARFRVWVYSLLPIESLL